MKVLKILIIVINLLIIMGCSKKQEFSDIFRCMYAAQTMDKYQEANKAANYLTIFTQENLPSLTQYEMMRLTSDVRSEFDHLGGVSLDTAVKRLYKAYNSSYCQKIYNK